MLKQVIFSAKCRVYRGEGMFYTGSREVQCWLNDGLTRIDVSGEALVIVALPSSTIWYLPEEALKHPVLLEVVLGPALIILLAIRQIWCLHASSVATSCGLIGFCAESGLGKSTLALDAGNDWLRVGDDILPVRVAYDGDVAQVTACLEFPQLKLPPEQQYVSSGSPLVPLKAVFRIMPDDGKTEIRIEAMSQSDAMLECVRHTVSSRLFGPDLLKAQLGAMKALASSVPVYALHYPRDMERLDEVRAAVSDTVCGR